MAEIIDRITELMKKTGDTAHSLEVNARLSISCVRSWKNGECKPSIDSIIKLAKYFDVSADYLLGLSEECNPTSFIPQSAETGNSLSAYPDELLHDKRFSEIIKMYNSLTELQKGKLYEYVSIIVAGMTSF